MATNVGKAMSTEPERIIEDQGANGANRANGDQKTNAPQAAAIPALGDLSLKAAVIAPVDDAWRASLPRDPEAATAAYMARISPAAKARSDAYFEGGYWLKLWDLLTGLLIAWLLLSTRLSVRIREWTEKKVKIRAFQLMIYASFYLAITWVLGFPLEVYEGFYREHQYGLSNLTFGAWMKEGGIAFLVSLILGSPMIAALYGVIRKFGKKWIVWGSTLAVGFMVFALLIAPVYIDPLFNQYKPLEAGPLKDSILSMARASGVPATDVLQFDASKQSDRVSANVSGIFGSAAIRLNDNLLRRTTLPEIKGVMGHEMGHYVMNHVYKGIVEFTLLILVTFAFISWSFSWVQSRFGAKWGVIGIDDIAGLPVLVALISVFMFLMTPINNTMTRTQETEADIFGLNAAREPDASAEVGLKLTEYRKSVRQA